MGKYKLSILKLDLGSTSEDSSSSIDVDESVFCESHFSLVQHEVHWGAQTSVWVPSQINVQGCCKSISTMAVLVYAYSDLWFKKIRERSAAQKPYYATVPSCGPHSYFLQSVTENIINNPSSIFGSSASRRFLSGVTSLGLFINIL